MCTNYVPTRGERLQAFFGVFEPTGSLRDEAWPGYMAPVIRAVRGTGDASPARECVSACFGIIPGWSRDGRNFRHCYNARSETVAEKPSFRNAWHKRQYCLVPAESFFEPSYETGRAIRWQIANVDGSPLALAAIWEAWRRPPPDSTGRRAGPADADLTEDGWLLSFSLLTINADGHSVMGRFHPPDDEKRSIVAIAPSCHQSWLSATPAQARDLLHSLDPLALTTRPAPRPAARSGKPPVARALPKNRA